MELDPVSELVRIGLAVAARGWVAGTGGNASLRAGSTIWIKATGERLADGDRRSWIAMNSSGETSRQETRAPSVERPMHLAAYRQRPDIGAVLHCHPPLAIAWAATGSDLPALTPDFAAQIGPRAPLLPYFSPGSPQLAAAVGSALADQTNGLLLSNHGLVAIGTSLLQAFDRAALLVSALEAAITARGLRPGGVRPLPRDEIAALRRSYGRRD